MRGPPASSFTAGPNCKVGVLNKKCRGFFKWGMRYVVVDLPGRQLLYYHTSEDKEPKRIIELTRAAVRLLDFAENSAHGFRLTTTGPTGRDYDFIGTDLWIVEKWVDAITSATQSTQTSINQTVSPQSLSGVTQTRGATSVERTLVAPPGNAPVRKPSLNEGKTLPTSSSLHSVPQGPHSNQSTGSTLNGNTTIQPTILANGAQSSTKRQASQTTIAVITMTPENKRLNPIEKDVVGIIKIGRTVAGAQADDNCVTFRTKVVSRQHAEIWAINGDVYIRDVGSQTGTFLNAMRLSETGKDSKPYRLRSGDTVQFGVDFNKTDDDTSRCVTLKVEIRTRLAEVDETSNALGGSTSDRTTNATVSGTTQTNSPTLLGSQTQQPTLVAQQGGGGATMIAQGSPNPPTMVAGQQSAPPAPPQSGQPHVFPGHQMVGQMAAAQNTSIRPMAQVLPGGQMNQGGNFVIMSGPPGGPQFFRPPMPQMMQSAVARPGFAQNGAAPVIMMGGQPRPMMMPVTSQYPK